MSGLDALGIWWGYAEGDPRIVGAIVGLVAAAAAVFVARRTAAAIRDRRATARGRQ